MLPPVANDLEPAYIQAAQELHDNPGQWQVYESEHNCVVLAGPGSGKTKTLTIKLARMLHEDVKPPHKIACITYSQECARELRRRLEKLGVNNQSNVFIGTVHSFCLSNILVPFSRMANINLPESFRIANSNQRKTAFDFAVQQVSPTVRINPTKMDFYRRTYIDRDQTFYTVNEQMAQVVDCYEQELHQNGLIDFDDIVIHSLGLVENRAWVRKVLKAKYPILVVDEYQDLGLSLHRIIQSLCFISDTRLLAVGDPDQSIYGFTGAQPSLLCDLATVKSVEPVTLKMNYRCGKSIVEASEIVLDQEIGSHDVSEDNGTGTVNFHLCPEGIDDQAEFICTKLIPEAIDRIDGLTLGDIAVLYVDKNDGDIIANHAKTASYDYIRIDNNAPYQKTALTRWIEDCAQWCTNGWRLGEPKLSSLIYTWQEFNNVKNRLDHTAIKLKQDLVKFLWASRDTKSDLHSWLTAFNKACLNRTFFEGCEIPDEYEALNKLLTACSPGHAIDAFTVATLGGQGGSPNHLNLITLYSAKGREFKLVVMMGMDQGRIPSSWADKTKAAIAEKRRLFYVGITRAIQEVHLTYSGWYQTRYGPQQLGPSIFLQQLQDSLTT